MAYQRFRIVTNKEQVLTKVFDADTGEQLYNVDFIGAGFDADGQSQVTLRLFADIEIETDHVEVKVHHFDTGKPKRVKGTSTQFYGPVEFTGHTDGLFGATVIRRGRP